MKTQFLPELRPVLIGSLPYQDHEKALAQVIAHTPEIPLWVQLPSWPWEQMIPQFIHGMPGLRTEDDRMFIDLGDDAFDEELLAFYEAYLFATEAGGDLAELGFALIPETAGGFFTLVDYLKSPSIPPVAVKGQVTGPITFGTGVKDEKGRSIFYNEQARDAVVKFLALNARWQIQTLSASGYPVIMFIDEPALAGFGSSELISISKEEIIAGLGEVVTAIHAEEGIAGIHVCANTDWDLVLASGVDIVDFDAYLYFDRFILYPDQIKTFIDNGGILAWGIVPTGDPAHIERETPESLADRWRKQARQVVDLGINMETLMAQSLITPSCGTGSMSIDHAEKVLKLTMDLSHQLRNEPQ
jgi:methionine synthase II (cobalamin-independent)